MTDTAPLPVITPGSDVVIVAVDGPAGSGKSSVSKQVARALGFGYLDTGAAYRALAWHALAREIDTSDATAVLEAASNFDFSISLDPDAYWVRSGEADVTEAIREQRVTDAVSGVARVPAVRRAINSAFRQLIAASGRPGVVVEGRDITTVVAPDAPARILLTASIRLIPSALSSSISRIMSPGRMPALSAGVSGMGARIVTSPFLMPTSAPIPSKKPFRSWVAILYCSVL